MNKMTKKAVLSLFLLVGVGACGGGGSSEPAPSPTPPPVQPSAGTIGDGQLPAIVEWARSTYGLPSMATAIVRNGQVVEATAEGARSSSSSERVTIGDQWHIGSLTKAMTATLAGVLVEMSVLSWDTTPLEVWPELDATIHADLRGITIRQLLSHNAGIRTVNDAPPQYLDEANGTVTDRRRAFSAELLAEGPVTPVGEQFYTNGGYVIAGAMMETLMSASWESLMQDYVFAALDMPDTGFGAPGVPGSASQPWGHLPSGNGYQPVAPGPDADNPQLFGPAGTLHTTMGDYANFMMAHIAGARGIDGFLTASTYGVLHEPVHSGSALGWGVIDIDQIPGAIELGHAGTNLRWYAVVRLVPDLDAGVILVTNAGGDNAANGIAALEDVIAERFSNSL